MWFKVDDGFYDHPKVLGLDMAARGLWVSAGAYCARHLTDGIITGAQIRAIGGTINQAEKLVKIGLWTRDEAPPNARRYAFDDWRDFQPTRAEVLSKRQEARDRMAKARAKRAKARENAEKFARTNGERSGEVRSDALRERSPYPDPTRPDHIDISIPNGISLKSRFEGGPDHIMKSKSKLEAPGFEEFWGAYPRKVGKKTARAKYQAACKRATPEAIFAGAKRLASDPNLPEKQYIPHPATWLNRDGWDDEPLPSKNPQQAVQTPLSGREAWDRSGSLPDWNRHDNVQVIEHRDM
ncbi:hypothetical protein GP475_08860 [Corynebacterium poyangense]|uniref:Uncharacterized protein n=1 Tax=Corynebacterium poyangense TaxID=2684405 RepID=A0A7H0SQB1_9CORY|nr:hypothetical protein [Corynebacterium poyangense]QNQ90736.1 hypothetical protein GP475_08860 [Corynebacterium poyangense]